MSPRESMFSCDEAQPPVAPRSNDGGTKDTSETKTDRNLGDGK